MKIVYAILITAGLLIAAFAASYFSGVNCVFPMVAITALAAAVDSRKLELKRYHSGISYGPVILFFLLLLFWAAGFPWYLYVRQKIKDGTATKKESITALA